MMILNVLTNCTQMRECEKAADAIKICMERDIRPRNLMTKASFENALVLTMALGLVGESFMLNLSC